MKLAKFFVTTICIFCCFSCNNKSAEKKEKLILHTPSELALLMEEMFVLNDSIKSQILRDEQPTEFPEKLKDIHSAEMSTNFSRDSTYMRFANSYLDTQQKIYTSSSETIKNNFNTTINTCIACHQTSCTGPIPRIRKLLIN